MTDTHYLCDISVIKLVLPAVSDVIVDQVLGVAVGQASPLLLSQVFSWV